MDDRFLRIQMLLGSPAMERLHRTEEELKKISE